MQITFRVEQAIRGVRNGQVLAIREWAGLWNSGDRYRPGERLLLFLYKPSKFGLTSPVGGPMGRFPVDSGGNVILENGWLSALSLDSASQRPLRGRILVNSRAFALAIERRPPSNQAAPRAATQPTAAPNLPWSKSWHEVLRAGVRDRFPLRASAIGASWRSADVAGASYFDATQKGVPLSWARGAISYYTDQGNLSPILPEASADAFVADAFSRWTSISTAAVSAVRAGQLGEDVSGANVSSSGGALMLPVDILPSAVNLPVAIVYDADGAVTNALLGEGAGSASACFNNAAYGGVDSFSADAHLLHALVVLNGVCAQTSQQLPDLRYRLVRVLGRVLGLDWSQMNVNVFTRNPRPLADYDGLTIMHAIDPINCVPIAICYTNADQPKMDDRAALSRLYPVTAENQASFPGKELFAENTVRIHGVVHFADASGRPAQPMQGVNVIARWIDPATGQPSRTYAAASVSGFLFHGNAGNPATGFSDSTGQAFDRFGSDDTADEGFFDLAGLEIPNGASSAQYQLSVEPLDPLWSQTVGPYGPWQVRPPAPSNH